MSTQVYDTIDIKLLKSLPVKDISKLAASIRDKIIESSYANGGHLASNLGIVELTLALHYVFDSPYDKLIFDVGHQCYTHKLLTGRDISKIRTNEVSGFPLMSESEHDAFGTGHSSTSLSAGMGMAVARDLLGGKNHIVSIIGDASISNGLAFEALNNIGVSGTRLIMILNDNKMSISGSVGAMSKILGKIRLNKGYTRTKKSFKHAVSIIPLVGNSLVRFAEKTKSLFKFALVHSRWFEELGIKYIGPIDGHNIPDLIEMLRKCKSESGPVLLHVITTKGKGLSSAENDPEAYHGLSQRSDSEASFSKAAGDAVIKLAENDAMIVAVTAAMPSGTGSKEFSSRFPDRFFDTGIAESHAVTFCAGLCAGGFKPYFFVYSTFLQRGFDGIIHDCALQKLPVRFLIDRAGLVGSDGATHQGMFDLSYLRLIPDLIIAAPMDTAELADMIEWSKDIAYPIAIRYPKSTLRAPAAHEKIALGKWEKLSKNKSKNIFLCVGDRMITLAEKVRDLLLGDAVIYNARFIKPLDSSALDSFKMCRIFTFEENVSSGGFGSAVLEYYSEFGNITQSVKCFNLGSDFINCSEIDAQSCKSGLNPPDIAKIVKATSK